MSTQAILDPRDGVVTIKESWQPPRPANETPVISKAGRAIGMLTALVLGAIVGVIGLLVEDWMILVFLGAFGAPVAGLLGWRMTAVARSSPDLFGVGLAMGFGAWLLGVTAFVVLASIPGFVDVSSVQDLAGLLAAGALVWILGVIVMSPAVILTIPLGIVWAVLIRRMPTSWFARRSTSAP